MTENCSKDLARFNPPVSEDELDAAEQVIGRPLSQDLKEWWRFTNGVQDSAYVSLIPSLFSPLSVRRSLALREACLKGYNDLYRDTDLNQFTADFARGIEGQAGTLVSSSDYFVWLPQRLPIASSPGTQVFVDLRPGPAYGCMGPFIPEQHEDPYLGEPEWDSVGSMLADIADALVHGHEMRGYTAKVEDGRLTWEYDLTYGLRQANLDLI